MKKLLFLLLLFPFLGFSQVIPAADYVISNKNTQDAYPNFQKLTTAVNYLNLHGVGGNVRFLLDDDQTVTSQITINAFPNPTNSTVTIKPNVGKDVAITGKIENGSVIALNGAHHIIIDGNNDKNDNKLKIYNSYDTSNSYSKRVGIWLFGGSENNKFQNLTIQLNILGISVGTYSTGIYSGSSTIGGTENNSNNSILNTTFKDVKQAIIINGSTEANKNWIIQNNKIGSVDDNYKPFLGIYIQNASEYNISNNAVDGVRLPGNLGGSTNHSGIYLVNVSKGVIFNNVISNIKNSAGNSVGYGIYVKGDNNTVNQNIVKNLDSNSTNEGSYGIRSEGKNTTIYNNDIANVFSSEGKNTNGIYISGDDQLVYNNFINDVKSAGGGGTDSQNGFGIYINSGSVVRLYYNTVVLKTNQNSGVSAALFINSGSHLDIRNNIFANMQTSSSTTRFAIYSTVNGAGNFDFLDFNDYYSNQHIGSWGNYYSSTNIKSTLNDWRAVTSKDAGSIVFSPNFLNTTDLHLQSGTINNALKIGTPLSGINTDIDGDIRDTKTPYIGADEIVCKLGVPAILTTEPTCGAASTAKITNYSSGNTYDFLPIGPSVGSDGFISGLTPGISYTVSAKNGTCSSVASLSFSVASQTTVFNGSWSTPPTANLSAVIRSGYSSNVNGKLNVCSLTITNNSAVTINKENSFTVQNNVKVDAGSSLTVESDANLIQVNDNAAANLGNITVLRDIQIGSKRTEYNYLGSPVTFIAGQNLKTIYPGIAFTLYHNEANNLFGTSSGANIPGRGLAVKEPTITGVPADNTKVTATYTGVPQNGKIPFPLAYSNTGNNTSLGYNLLANPYPSNIDLTALYELNGGDRANGKASENISATFYFWDNEVNDVYAQAGSAYKGQAYAIFNAFAGSKGTGTKAAGYLSGTVPVTGKKTPVQIINVGQGFMTKALVKDYTLVFNNSIRTDAAATASFLGKSQEQNVEDDRFWLQLISPAHLTSTMAVVYFNGGNSAFGAEDSESKLVSDDIFSLVDDHKIVINGKNSFINSDKISLGTLHFQAGVYTIGAAEREGVFANGQNIYLKDKQTGIITNLTQGTYSFDVNAGETSERFEIIYQPDSVLVTDNKVKDGLVVYRDGNDFVIRSNSEKISSLEIYETSGKLISKLQPNSTKVLISSERMNSGMYILKINQNGKISSKKILK